MKAMILAAGHGVRMMPLTKTCPKPLLKVHGTPMIVQHLRALREMDITDVVINISYKPDKFLKVLGDGSQYGVNIHYSLEPYPLGTAGGIVQAMPLLGEAPFVVLSGDIWTDYPFRNLMANCSLALNSLAHIVLVDNPHHHPEGDFCLCDNRVYLGDDARLNFSGIGIYHPQLFAPYSLNKCSLGALLSVAIAEGKVSGEYYSGKWFNIGTAKQLRSINAERDEAYEK